MANPARWGFRFAIVLHERRRWDSNPRAGYPTTAFRVRLVMTTSIHLQKSLHEILSDSFLSCNGIMINGCLSPWHIISLYKMPCINSDRSTWQNNISGKMPCIKMTICTWQNESWRKLPCTKGRKNTWQNNILRKMPCITGAKYTWQINILRKMPCIKWLRFL